jgi:hypothetical protein
MIAAVHALTGAALGRFCRAPGRAFALGFVSHLPLDLSPHRDLEIAEEGLLLGAALGLVAAARGFTSPEFAGALGAAAPDVENVVARALDIPDEKLLLPTHSRFHGRKVRGLRGQLALALCCLAVLCWPTGQGSRQSSL